MKKKWLRDTVLAVQVHGAAAQSELCETCSARLGEVLHLGCDQQNPCAMHVGGVPFTPAWLGRKRLCMLCAGKM